MAVLSESSLPAPVRWLRCLAAIVLPLFTCEAVRGAESTSVNDLQVKAVFLYNFTQFVRWPPTAFSDAHQPFVISILGTDPFGAYLDEVVRDENVNGRPVVIQRCGRVEEVRDCAILFIGESAAADLPRILARLGDRPVLTVATFPGFCDRGGMVRLDTANNRVRLRVNVEAATRVHLVISSKLLRPAQIIAPRPR